MRQWNRWRHERDENARRLLLAYNEADYVNLQPLADAFYCLLVQASGLGELPVGQTSSIRQPSLLEVCDRFGLMPFSDKERVVRKRNVAIPFFASCPVRNERVRSTVEPAQTILRK